MHFHRFSFFHVTDALHVTPHARRVRGRIQQEEACGLILDYAGPMMHDPSAEAETHSLSSALMLIA